MKRIFVVALLLLAAVPTSLLAKGETVKITISGRNLNQPVEITDSKLLDNFKVWTGPGTSSNEAQGLIVDWAKGAVPKRPSGLPLYEVSFYANLPQKRLVYVAFYEFDPVTGEGFVYLPGKKDPSYALNVSTIFHGVEGKWFYAWSAWDSAARPLIAKAGQAAPNSIGIAHGQSFR